MRPFLICQFGDKRLCLSRRPVCANLAPRSAMGAFRLSLRDVVWAALLAATSLGCEPPPSTSVGATEVALAAAERSSRSSRSAGRFESPDGVRARLRNRGRDAVPGDAVAGPGPSAWAGRRPRADGPDRRRRPVRGNQRAVRRRLPGRPASVAVPLVCQTSDYAPEQLPDGPRARPNAAGGDRARRDRSPSRRAPAIPTGPASPRLPGRRPRGRSPIPSARIDPLHLLEPPGRRPSFSTVTEGQPPAELHHDVPAPVTCLPPAERQCTIWTAPRRIVVLVQPSHSTACSGADPAGQAEVSKLTSKEPGRFIRKREAAFALDDADRRISVGIVDDRREGERASARSPEVVDRDRRAADCRGGGGPLTGCAAQAARARRAPSRAAPGSAGAACAARRRRLRDHVLFDEGRPGRPFGESRPGPPRSAPGRRRRQTSGMCDVEEVEAVAAARLPGVPAVAAVALAAEDRRHVGPGRV